MIIGRILTALHCENNGFCESLAAKTSFKY